MRDQTLIKRVVATLLFLTMATHSAYAGDWPQWRGPNFNGATDEAALPSTLSPTETLLWSADLPGMSSASPVVVGNKVFLVSNDSELKKLFGICIDRDTGKLLWSKQLSEAQGPIPRNTMASSSPVADAERVYFLFGTGVFIALDHDGNEIWSRNIKDLGDIELQFGYSSSPLLYQDKLFLPILRGQWRSDIPHDSYSDKDSYLLCIDAKTGQILYRVHRQSDAIGESHDSYTTAVPYEAGEQPEIVIQGGDYTTGHDPATGAEKWRFADNLSKRANWRLIPSPVIAGDLVFNAQPRGGMAYAFDPKVPTQKSIDTAAWVFDDRTTDVPTPVVYEGKLYVLNGVQKTLTCINPVTGEVIWIGDMPDNSRFWASAAIADGKAYMVDEDGGVVVASVGDSFSILSTQALGGRESKSSPAIAAGKVFIRTADKLYCFAAK